MDVINFVKILEQFDTDFFTGVPDSQLAPLCNYLMKTYGIADNHIIAANEGNCVALAAGYHLSTGKIPVVYLQNSGIGNIVNPVVSLLNDKVYGIPCIFIIGWRGEPGIKDEPQHVFQGEITLKLLETMDITTFVLNKNTTKEELEQNIPLYKSLLENKKSIAIVVKKDALTYEEKVEYKNPYCISREDIIRHIVACSYGDIFVSTTGKTSRELFEIREQNQQSHKFDFLTVGSMGHSSSIAFSIAKNKPNSKVWCIDGDGAALMHMGAMALIGSNSPANLIHVVINNNAHESVGGLPTVAGQINLVQIALGCGYPKAISVQNFEELDKALETAKNSNCCFFIEVKAALGAREDLGRPTTTAKENKENFMKFLKEVY